MADRQTEGHTLFQRIVFDNALCLQSACRPMFYQYLKLATSVSRIRLATNLTHTNSQLNPGSKIVGQHVRNKFNGKLDPKQFGAVKGRSTVHALIDLLHMWHSALDKGKSVCAVFIDYAKAFDHVHHSTILQTLKSFGVEPVIINWIHSFLSSRQQRVKLGNTFSDWTTLIAGLPQGTWLGPLLFIGQINDLATFYLSIIMLMTSP